MVTIKFSNEQPFQIYDHQGSAIYILPEVAEAMGISPDDRLDSAEKFWSVVNNNNLASIAWLRHQATQPQMAFTPDE